MPGALGEPSLHLFSVVDLSLHSNVIIETEDESLMNGEMAVY